MKAQIKFFLENFTDETMAILAIGCALVMGVIIVFWLYNRKKFHRLSHQIPASIVKNYLESIIQNSTALKSSLFRGGGEDVGEGIPSVVSLKDLGASKLTVDHLAHEELAQKNAEIQSLQQQLADKDQAVQDLESKCQDLQQEQVKKDDEHGAQVKALESEIADLKDQLAAAQQGGGGEAAEKLTKQIETLQNKLKEYEVIEGELSNLKHLQQENEQLKKSLTDAGIEIPVVAPPAEEKTAEAAPQAEQAAEAAEAAPAAEASAAEDAPAPEAKEETPAATEAPVKAEVSADEENAAPEAKREEAPAETSTETTAEAQPDNVVPLKPTETAAENKEAPAEAAATPPAEGAAPAAEGTPADEGQEKSAEELLSEFEKMLG